MVTYPDDSGITRGALLLGAENATAAGVNIMAREGRGVVCVGLTAEAAERLELRPMIPCSTNERSLHSVCTVSVDAKLGITTGISASDRAHTLQLLASPSSSPDDFVRPGHLFPYVVHPHGVLGRSELAEASVDLVRLAGLEPVGTFCGILDTNGGLAQEPYLLSLAERANLPVISMDDLVHYRLFTTAFVTESTLEPITTKHGSFELTTYSDLLHGEEHSALYNAIPLRRNVPPTVYVHRACLRGDVFGSVHCECREHLAAAQMQVQDDGGLVLYVGQRTPGDMHACAVAAQMLAAKGVSSLRLFHPWPGLSDMLGAAGLVVVDEIGPTNHGCAYRAQREAVAL